MTAPVYEHGAASRDWHSANREYLALRLEELRLRLQNALTSQGENTRTDPALRSRILRVRDEAIAARRPPALDLLTSLFSLSELEQDVLLLTVAPDMDDGFADLLSADSRRRRGCMAQAFAPHRNGAGAMPALDALMPGRPLRRFALVASRETPECARWSLRAPLYSEERILAFLRGNNIPERRIAQLVHALDRGLEAPGHMDAVAEVASALDRKANDWPLIRIAADSYADAREVAKAGMRRAGLNPVELDLLMLAEHRSEWEELFSLLAREAALDQAAYWIGCGQQTFDPALAALARLVIEELEAPLLAFAGMPFPSECRSRTVWLPPLSRRGQHEAWQCALASMAHSLNGELDQIVQQFDMGPADIANASRLASEQAEMRSRDGSPAIISADDVWSACRRHSELRLDDLARRIEPCFTWDDIVVPAAVMAQLREITAQVQQRARVYETWGFGARLARGRGISVLFAGGSGMGKTMAAEVIANELRLDLYCIDLSGVINKYVGETEKNLRRVFDAAERSGAILFFDEADALFGTRTEVRDSHDRYANIEVNYLLQRMESYSGLAILATNRKQALDPAFLRRLRFVVDFPFPDFDHRRRIWQRVFPAEALLDQLDYGALARLEISGGNIKTIAINAAFLAAAADSPITTLHVMRAAAREFAKLDRVITAPEFGTYAEMVRK
jgi:hypothetical protein